MLEILHVAQNDNASHFRSHVLAPHSPPQAATGCPNSSAFKASAAIRGSTL